MDKRELERMTMAELKKIALKYKISITPKMRKAEVIKSISKGLKKGAKTLKKAKTSTKTAEKGKATTAIKAVKRKSTPALPRHVVPQMTTKQERKKPIKKAQPPQFISEEERIEEAKYRVGARFEEVPYDRLPEEYNVNRLVLIPRDPYWAYAYWEITPGKIEELRQELKDPKANLTIRIYDATEAPTPDRALSIFDVEVFQRVGNWHLEIGRPGRHIYAGIGMKSRIGEFLPIATSNFVTAPVDSVSELTDAEWSVSEEDFGKIFAASGGFGAGLSTAQMIELMEKRVEQEVSSPGIFSPGLWSPGAWSLFKPVSLEEKERKFWFWVKTELIVYGATEPDATVLFQGTPVKLKPDGTFHMRFALPDGIQIMPIKATSANGLEERSVTPVVMRETK